jgi:hypothetical protein
MSAPEPIEHERRFWELTPAERETTLARMAVEVFSEVHWLNPQIAVPFAFSAADLHRLVRDISMQERSRGSRGLVVVPFAAGVLGLFKYLLIQTSRGDPFAPQVVQVLFQTWWGPAIGTALLILLFDAVWSYFNPPPQRVPASLLAFASELADAGASGETQNDQVAASSAWLPESMPMSLAASSITMTSAPSHAKA